MSDLTQRIARLSPEQQALLEKRLKGVSGPPAAREPVAIIGMACRFPGGADSPEAFGRLLRDGRDAIREVPPDRWDVDALHDPDPAALGKISTRFGGFLEDVDQFDAGFFGISPREAARMDPQQRLLLEVAWDAFEDAGQTREQLARSATGVFVGAHSHASDYLWLQYLRPAELDAFSGTGTAHNLLAGRLSYFLDVQGPAVAVDTACSSSAVAVHLAMQSLRSAESDMALAAGVNVILTPHFSIAASRMHMLAGDGRCKAFDHRADGFVRGEGCGAVVLKRLSDARAAGDPVVAVLRGSAINQDGRTNGITAPNGKAQEAVIERALADAGVAPERIGYVEAHGTGTALGDPIEVEALAATLGRSRAEETPCFVGSVKTNLGHLEGAAGIAGLIKAALVLRSGEIPPNLHFQQLNPHIQIGGTRLQFPAETTPWPSTGWPRAAGVSSFGWSGSNAHLVLEEAAGEDRCSAPEGWQILPISAGNPAALEALARRFHERLESAEDAPNICFTASVRRTHLDHRLAVVGRSAVELRDALGERLQAGIPDTLVEGRGRVVFVFPGQGSQWIGMGRELLREEPVFREAIERCDAAFRAEVDWSLLERLRADDASWLGRIEVVQPVLFAMEVALAEQWQSWGVVPLAVVGHSMGEVAAAHVAGALSLEDATRVICRRSRLLRGIAGRGAMAVVELSAREAEEALSGFAERLSVAVINGPRSVVMSGEPKALEEVMLALQKRDVFCRPVKVDVASHSPQVDELGPALLDELAGLAPRPASIPLVSTVTGRFCSGEDLGSQYWLRNLREPVRFFEALRLLLAEGHDSLLEASPHPILLPSIEDAIDHAGKAAVAVPSLRREQDERGALLSGLAGLYALGTPPNWRRLFPGGGTSVPLPRYPWQRERHWLPDGSTADAPAPAGHPEHRLLGWRVELAGREDLRVWEQSLTPASPLCAFDHELRGTHVLAASAYAEIAGAMGGLVPGLEEAELTDLELRRVLRLPQDGEQVRVQLVLATAADGPTLEVYSRVETEWLLHARARLTVPEDQPDHSVSLDEATDRCSAEIDADGFYGKLAEHGVALPGSLRGIGRLRVGESEVLAELAAMDEESGGPASSSPIDAALQLASVDPAGLVRREGRLELGVPTQIGRVRRPVARPRWALASYGGGEGPGSVRRDVWLLDEHGRGLGGVFDVRVQALSADASGADSQGWLHAIEWRQKDRDMTSGGAADRRRPGRWLLLTDRLGVGEALARRVSRLGDDVRCLPAASSGSLLEAELDWLAGGEAGDHRVVVHLGPLDLTTDANPTDTEIEAIPADCLMLTTQLGCLARREWARSPRLWVVTRGAQAVAADQPVALAQAPIWGLCHVLGEEHPDLWGGLIDIDPTREADPNASVLERELLSAGDEPAVGFREGTRHVARLVPLPSPSAGTQGCRSAATYVVTGGLGALGLEAARWLAAQGARHLVLMARTPVPSRDQWDEAALPERLRRAVATIQELEDLGVSVHTAAVDVGDDGQLGAFFEACRREGGPPIRGIVHAAGVAEGRLLAETNQELLDRVMRPKVRGAWLLLRHADAEALDFFVFFSSIAAFVGQAGQAAYAAANAFLDALAHNRRTGLPALSVNWGVWANTADHAGAGVREGAAALEERGFGSFGVAEGFALLGRILPSDLSRAVVVPLDRERLRKHATGAAATLLEDLLASDPGGGGGRARAATRARLQALPVGERWQLLETHLKEQLSEVLKLPAHRIEVERPLGALGLESLTGLELRRRLEVSLGLKLPATLVWNYPTVAALVAHLATRMGLSLDDGSEPEPERAEPAPSAAQANLPDLTDEEALQLLRKPEEGAP